ncbi:HAUS augmin-like complex subunit 3 isoform X1 [Frieseomelitta varia]|uniref:HAUS augmin-like complex subunit 3 isoform X1 n=1 Tax=Frieseomelitta varia TaxID=561572 RepID=UPI001CB69272|nr:HAUS augmin-like complex subunit 3 isoform X1 [Frieseomelitta varia]
MDVTGKVLYDKIRCLRPELSNVVTSEMLDIICDKPLVQPFLKWFCKNVNYVNVLSNEDIEIKNKLQEMNEWLEDSELDYALEEAAKDCPDLLRIISFDDADINNLFVEYEIIKDSYKEDENYIHKLQNGIQNLKKLETELDEDIEKKGEFLDKENIKANRTYKECFTILKKFDVENHQFFKEVEYLLNVYADAAKNKGIPLLWTQMPLELFIRNIELYNHYLDIYIKRQFGNTSKEEQKTDSDYVSLIANNKEKTIDNEKLQQLTLCKKNLTNAKLEEILTKVQEESYIAMLNYIEDIYNLGHLKVPKHSELRTEILKLTRKRDALEEDITLLQEHQLTEVVQQFSQLEITKILKQDAHTRLERAKNHLEELRNLRYLARERGHVRIDLLRMLMEMQFQCLKNVSEFVGDAYHYLITEYSLSSTRCKADTNFEREKNILWQRFLIDPDTLRRTYKQLKNVTNRSCFDDVYENELSD